MKTFGVVYTGYIKVDEDGVYGFGTSSAAGSELLVDDQPVADNDGKHGIYDQEGAIALKKGFHKITVKYFDNGTYGALHVFMTLPDKPKGEITPADMLN